MKKIAIIGDSHSRYFVKNVKVRSHLPTHLKNLNYTVSVNHGATIRGFGKRKSTLGLKNIINEACTDDITDLLLALGQVDIELGIYYKSLIKKQPIDDFIAETIDIYKNYLCSIQKTHDVSLTIKGLNPTVLIYQQFARKYVGRIVTENVKDEEQREILLQKVHKDLPGIQERHMLSLTMNQQLRKLANDLNITYIDLWEYFLDERTGLIKNDYIPTSFDHHVIDSIEVRRAHSQLIFDMLYI